MKHNGDRSAPVPALYTDQHGETAIRSISPVQIRFGANQWHPRPQWLLEAFDHDRGAYREFALSGFRAIGATNASSTVALARSALKLSTELVAAIQAATEALTQRESDAAGVQAALEILADAHASACPPPADTATTSEPPL